MAEETAQQLAAPAALPEDLCLVPSTYTSLFLLDLAKWK